MDKFYIYILKSGKTGKYYIGSTNNLNDRVKRHNLGKNKSTKPGVPWSLVYSEFTSTKQDAYKREFEIKRYKGGEAFKRLIYKIK